MKRRKRVLVIGATSGVGLSLVRQLKERSYDVIAVGRNESRLRALEAYGVTTHRADVTCDTDLEEVVDRYASVDVVLFSAGVGSFKAADELSFEEIERMCATNIEAPMKWTARLLPKWKERKSGHFIWIGSQAGKVATPKASVYAATKHALIGYTNALRMEVAPYGIDVSVVHPGPIDTPFIDEADETGAYKASVGTWLLRPEEVAKRTVRLIERPVREVNMPRVMGVTSKWYAVMPRFVEWVGRPFFMKK